MKSVWSYGVTTVPQRSDTTLPRTLASLKAGGFDKPRLFVDGGTSVEPYLSRYPDLDITLRSPAVKTFGNWTLALWELYIRNPDATRFAVFQDDFICYRNLRQYLESCRYPHQGYWNLYTFPSAQSTLPQDKIGWHQSPQLGRGAVGLVFNRETVTTLFQGQVLVTHPQTRKGDRKVDAVVVTALRNAGWKEYVHNPSLTQHIGDETTIEGQLKHPHAPSFRNEQFDALELLKEQ